MNKEQQLKYDQALIVSLSDEYNRVKEVADALRNDINSLDFEERMPDSQERYLLVEKLKTTEGYQTNLLNRIRFYRHRIQVNKPQPWEVDEAIRQQDVQNRPVCGDAIDTKVESHHCGLDTRRHNEAAKKLCDLLVKGRKVVYAPGEKCNKCGGNLFEGFGEEEGGEIICFNCASQINNEELQQALDEYKAACLHHGDRGARFSQGKRMCLLRGVYRRGDHLRDKGQFSL